MQSSILSIKWEVGIWLWMEVIFRYLMISSNHHLKLLDMKYFILEPLIFRYSHLGKFSIHMWLHFMHLYYGFLLCIPKFVAWELKMVLIFIRTISMETYICGIRWLSHSEKCEMCMILLIEIFPHAIKNFPHFATIWIHIQVVIPWSQYECWLIKTWPYYKNLGSFIPTFPNKWGIYWLNVNARLVFPKIMSMSQYLYLWFALPTACQIFHNTVYNSQCIVWSVHLYSLLIINDIVNGTCIWFGEVIAGTKIFILL